MALTVPDAVVFRDAVLVLEGVTRSEWVLLIFFVRVLTSDNVVDGDTTSVAVHEGVCVGVGTGGGVRVAERVADGRLAESVFASVLVRCAWVSVRAELALRERRPRRDGVSPWLLVRPTESVRSRGFVGDHTNDCVGVMECVVLMSAVTVGAQNAAECMRRMKVSVPVVACRPMLTTSGSTNGGPCMNTDALQTSPTSRWYVLESCGAASTDSS